jgi:hypothetical protein
VEGFLFWVADRGSVLIVHSRPGLCVDRADRRGRDLSHEIAGMAEASGQRVAENYWFKCSACDYDWPRLLMPSIIFISLSFVTDQCPNCGKKHVPAYKVGPGR